MQKLITSSFAEVTTVTTRHRLYQCNYLFQRPYLNCVQVCFVQRWYKCQNVPSRKLTWHVRLSIFSLSDRMTEFNHSIIDCWNTADWLDTVMSCIMSSLIYESFVWFITDAALSSSITIESLQQYLISKKMSLYSKT